jgi:hypothetical protein
MKTKEIIEITRQIAGPFRVTKGESFRLKDVDPSDTLDFTKEEHKPLAKEALAMGVAALADLQDKLYARDRCSSFKQWTQPARMARSSTSCQE